MSGFGIGVNALRAAAQRINMAGDNIANAGTEGYHAKTADVVVLPGPSIGGVRIGEGCEVVDITRIRNRMVEASLLANLQVSERLSVEVNVLDQLEMLFNEPSDSGLDARLGAFFDSVEQLAAQPESVVLREQVVQDAQSVCMMFRRLDDGLASILDTLRDTAGTLVDQVNALTRTIADFNKQIKSIEAGGTSAPGLKDKRDQCITELAKLVNLGTYEAEYGVVNVSCSGALLVSGGESSAVELVQTEDGLHLSRAGSTGHEMGVMEGQLAGVLEMGNSVVPDYRQAVDDLANGLRRAMNMIHTTSLGLDGRFRQLAGSTDLTTDVPLSELGYGVPTDTAAKLVINVEDDSTGVVTQYELTLDTTEPGSVFVGSLRDAVNTGVAHVSANIVGGAIVLQADPGHSFGFATPYDPNPAGPGDITAADPTTPMILDDYTGESDLVYEFSFLNDGEIGTDAIDIQITVSEPAGTVLRTFTQQIDDTYDPGDAVDLENGLKYTLSQGNVSAGDGFSFTAHTSTDPGGLLDVLGLNTFFDGVGGGDIHVADRIEETPELLGGALREMPGDNHRFLAMADVRYARLMRGGTATLDEDYRALLSDVATNLNSRSLQLQNQGQLVLNLENQRDSISGVSVDEEMVNLLQSQTLYTAALKFIQATDEILTDLINIL